MAYSKNSGYGQFTALDTYRAEFGKVVVVGKSGLANRQKLMEIFSIDNDGLLRFVSTIDAAVALCTSGAGDRIVVMPGHTETLSTAGAIALDVAGVRVIGLGAGSARPTLSFGAAAATVTVSVADVTVENIVFSAAFADVAKVFDVTTAKNLKVKNCEFKDSAVDKNFLAIADTGTTDNAADGLTFEGCKWVTPDAATTSLVKVDGDLDGLTVKGCYLNLGVNTNDLPAVATVATGKDLTNLIIEDNKVIRLNDANPLLVTCDTTTANTGIIKGNFVRHADTAGELLVTAATNIGFFDNKATAVADASGFLLPAADS